MAQADSKVVVLGALAGVAGIGIAAIWYQSLRSRRRGSWPGVYLNSTNESTATGVVRVDSPGLSSSQAEVLQRLEALIQCVSELKEEMKELKNALPALQDQVTVELQGRSRVKGAVGARRSSPVHRTTPMRRKRTVGAARTEAPSSEEAESEGGYITALTSSEEEETNESRQHEPVDKLSVLFRRIDELHRGTDADKRESLNTLMEKREEFGQSSGFLWRLTRAYCDIHDISSSLEEKKSYVETGKTVGEEAVRLNPSCAECHQWYAIICGIMAEYDTIQNKIKNGYVFKDHLDKAIQLNPQDPLSYYLLGRWCYAVAQLSWIERKVAATLFGEPPSATVEDALKNFLKVEEIHPKYSKFNYVYLAKCYKDIGRSSEARKMCEAACLMDTVSKEDKDAQQELDSLFPSLGI